MLTEIEEQDLNDICVILGNLGLDHIGMPADPELTGGFGQWYWDLIQKRNGRFLRGDGTWSYANRK